MTISKIRHSILSLLAIGILGVCLSACGGASYDKGDLDQNGIFRFEKVLFDTPAEQLQGALLKTPYKGRLINIYPNDPRYMEQVMGFTHDEIIRQTYDCIKQEYDDLSWLEKDLRSALDRAHNLDDEVNITKVSTFLTGQFDYESRTWAEGDELLISLDVYVLPKMEQYGYFGIPLYLVKLCRKEYLLSDCMTVVARNLVKMPDTQQPTLLDMMVMEGKAMYVVNQSLPNVADTIKLRYSKGQLDWMVKNEKNVWAYMMQEQLLFETDHNRFHNLTDEAPCTNAFGSESAPRSAAFIGWHIVTDYMDKTGASVKQLMDETDSQKILKQSGYKAR